MESDHIKTKQSSTSSKLSQPKMYHQNPWLLYEIILNPAHCIQYTKGTSRNEVRETKQLYI